MRARRSVVYSGKAVVPPPALARLGHPLPLRGRGISFAPFSLSRRAGEGRGGGATEPCKPGTTTATRPMHQGTPT